MPVSGWVVTLRPEHHAHALDALARAPEIALGEHAEGALRVALVSETPDVESEARLIADIQTWRGIAGLELAFVDFSDVELTDGRALLRRRRRRDASPQRGEG